MTEDPITEEVQFDKRAEPDADTYTQPHTVYPRSEVMKKFHKNPEFPDPPHMEPTGKPITINPVPVDKAETENVDNEPHLNEVIPLMQVNDLPVNISSDSLAERIQNRIYTFVYAIQRYSRAGWNSFNYFSAFISTFPGHSYLEKVRRKHAKAYKDRSDSISEVYPVKDLINREVIRMRGKSTERKKEDQKAGIIYTPYIPHTDYKFDFETETTTMSKTTPPINTDNKISATTPTPIKEKEPRTIDPFRENLGFLFERRKYDEFPDELTIPEDGSDFLEDLLAMTLGEANNTLYARYGLKPADAYSHELGLEIPKNEDGNAMLDPQKILRGYKVLKLTKRLNEIGLWKTAPNTIATAHTHTMESNVDCPSTKDILAFIFMGNMFDIVLTETSLWIICQSAETINKTNKIRSINILFKTRTKKTPEEYEEEILKSCKSNYMPVYRRKRIPGDSSTFKPGSYMEDSYKRIA